MIDNTKIILLILAGAAIYLILIRKEKDISNQIVSKQVLTNEDNSIIDEVLKENTHTNKKNLNVPKNAIKPVWAETFVDSLATNNKVDVPVPTDNTSNTAADFDRFNNPLGDGNSNINQDEIVSNIDADMAKLIQENKVNQAKFAASDLLPQEVNNAWFKQDISPATFKIDRDDLINVNRYHIGVNTIGQSLKVASWDLRSAPPCPKIVVSPWNQSTVEPDYNIKPL